MKTSLYDALEICLTDLERGATLDSCLAQFPALAAELRPILETARQARAFSQNTLPSGAYRRSRTRVLQAAAELRQQKPAALPFWKRSLSPARPLRLAFTAFAVMIFLLSGGTGLVSASSNALPGDQLYPVKRSWEGFRLSITFNPLEREHLERSYEKERVSEINELFNKKRTEHVYFQAIVENQAADFWTVDGVKIRIDHDAKIDAAIGIGSLVEIKGETDDGVLKAEEIRLIAPPTPPAAYPKPQSAPGSDETPSPEARETLRPSETASLPAQTREIEHTPAATEQGKTKSPDEEKTVTPTPSSHDSDDADHTVAPTSDD
ncbi:MAG: hypothetical protein OHK0031_14780 [Anaerolineales bacterium]